MGIEQARAQTEASPGELQSLIEEALWQHPRIKAATARVDAAAALPSQAGSLPDPVFGMSATGLLVDDPSLRASPMAGVELSLRQGLLFPGKRGRRRLVAEAAHQAERERSDFVAAEVKAGVQQSYWHLAMAERVETITRENLVVLEQIVEMAHSRFAVGGGAQQDVLQAQSALSELSAQLVQRVQQTLTARKALNTSVGRPTDQRLNRASPAPLDSIRTNREEIVRLSLEASPRIRIRNALVEQNRRALEEAQHDRWPDIAVVSGYRFREPAAGDPTEGSDIFFVGLNSTLPIFAGSKQNKRVQQAASQIGASLEAERDERLRVELAAEQLLDEISRLREQTLLYRDQVVPQDRLALDASLSDYSVARVGFLSVLENWQRLLRDEVTVETLRALRGTRIAELEALLGKEIR